MKAHAISRLFLLLQWWLLIVSSDAAASTHTSNHALIVSSSRYWFNYRHANNALLVYQLCRQQGIPDENIILMLADDYPANARNPRKNGMYVNGVDSLYDARVQVDYRGDDATVANILKVLLGKSVNNKRVLQTDAHSNIFIYWTGHGGDGFFKFQDYEEITATDIANVLDEMHLLQKYNEILFLTDTCQAFTLFDNLKAPRVYGIGSSLKDENSYAHHSDRTLGLSVIERYTYTLVEFIQKNGISNLKVKDAMVDAMNQRYHILRSHVGYKQTKGRDGSQIPLMDFLGHVPQKEQTIELMTVSSGETSMLDGFSSSLASTTNETDHSTQETNDNEGQSEKNVTDSDSVHKTSLEPTDWPFIALLVALVSAVTMTSRRW